MVMRMLMGMRRSSVDEPMYAIKLASSYLPGLWGVTHLQHPQEAESRTVYLLKIYSSVLLVSQLWWPLY